MTRPRVIETEEGLQGEFMANAYDAMMRQSRDKGQLLTNLVLQAGITTGLVLEIGPGPGYLGLEWLKQTEGTWLKGLDISQDMLKVAEKNAAEYGLTERVEYIHGDALQMPFEDEFFDGVFTNAALHEWADPERALNEIYRVLKPGGRYLITDLRRDMPFPIKWVMWLGTKPKEIRPGLFRTINASYTRDEVQRLLAKTRLKDASVGQSSFGLGISGQKKLSIGT
ncbi:MAG: class I SAM-dependent methyltransferase [Anaerolineae bacterium]|nr:class I SAM-dependent methyltransferase [Anaerolineae bacterium]